MRDVKNMNLKDKRALVTGGAARIGRAITEALLAEGAEVIVHFRTSEAKAKTLSPKTIQADLGDPAHLVRPRGSFSVPPFPNSAGRAGQLLRQFGVRHGAGSHEL